MAVTLQKWRNSVGVRLPKPMRERVCREEGDQTKSIDYVARPVRYLADAPAGRVGAVLARVAAILSL